MVENFNHERKAIILKTIMDKMHKDYPTILGGFLQVQLDKISLC